ncbi:MAG: radical SAM family heme chaperone HemW [Lachnospiraceae bacterium]|nr:radical SAM family heme chaperone HemW [Lachnospiraceae bacterium]
MNNNKSMGIYIHIPFCVKKCNYCDFLSFNSDEATMLSYINSLNNEIIANRQTEKTVATIFLGGGTPSILDPKHIYDILNTIYKYYHIEDNAEITIESNPGTLNISKLKDYKAFGINRLSIGLQSSIEAELKAIGRIHTCTQFLESYDAAIYAGFNNINIDIMSALPNQTIDSYKKTLETVIELNPTHISAYSLILEENTPLYDFINAGNEHMLPDEDTEREMYYMTDRLLKQSGFHRYEISNYAKDGFECRHNLSYWEDADYLGMGLGASSYMDGARYKNTSCLEKYINHSSNPKDIIENVTPLSVKDKQEEFMILGLRKIKGVSISQFEKLFSKNIYSVYGDVIEKYISMDLLSINDDTLSLTSKGIDVSNTIFTDFLLED